MDPDHQKKLKVAAAGEETCTEVPGISLEALEKDTLSHSRLVLILPERICYIGNSAIKSLKGRARIDGKAWQMSIRKHWQRS